MPAIPLFRDWYERKFGDLCEAHDNVTDCKMCGDWRFVRDIAKRGYLFIAIPTWIAVNMPWVWFDFMRLK